LSQPVETDYRGPGRQSVSILPSSALWKYWEQTNQPLIGLNNRTHAITMIGRVVIAWTQIGGSKTDCNQIPNSRAGTAAIDIEKNAGPSAGSANE
jgi:hypothetical protein